MRARRFAREQIFRVGVQIVEGAAKAEQAGPALADIAECVIAGLLPNVEAELAAERRPCSGRRLRRRRDGQAWRARDDRQLRPRSGVRL